MPSLHQTAALPWKEGATIHAGGIDLPWKDGATTHAAPSAYTPGSPPGGGTPTGPTAGVAPYTIPSRATYDVPHTMAVTDLRDDTTLEVDSLAIGIDADSAMWTLRAAGGESLYAKLTTGVQPAGVKVDLDGEAWVFVIDTVSRSRTFGDSQVSVSGRSLAVAAGSPYEADQNWVNDGPTTGAQIAAMANLYTGLSVSWEIEDWIVPDRVFSYSGTPLSVVLRVAEAVGAVVQAHRTEYGVRVLPRYALCPNKWATVAPDVEVAFDAVLSESFERADIPEYTGVYVSGQQQGAVGFVRLAGTSGSNLHPLITDLLLTDEPALRMRGMAVLGASGGQARVSLGLPLLTGAGEPGVLSVGQLVRVLDPEGTWHGLVRSVSVSAELPTITQTVVLERHTKTVEGSVASIVDTPNPLIFTGPLPDKTVVNGVAFSWDISSHWSGGTPPYTYSMRSGTLPTGLNLNPTTGVISGTVSGSGSPPTTVVQDTFTGGGSTPLASHTGETGASWTISTYRGTGAGSEIVVTGGVLKRSGGTGEVWAYPSGAISAAGIVTLSVRVKFTASGDGSTLSAADTWGSDPGDNYVQFAVDQNSVYVRGDIDEMAHTFTVGTEYLVEVVFEGTTRTLKIDGTTVATGAGDALLPPFLFGLYGTTVEVTSLEVSEGGGAVPPGGFPATVAFRAVDTVFNMADSDEAVVSFT